MSAHPLLRATALSCAMAVALGLVLMPALVLFLTDVLHVGCEFDTSYGSSEWVCSDGIGYVVPVMSVMGVVGSGIFVALVRRGFRSQPSSARRRAARLLAVVASVPLVLQLPAVLVAVGAGSADGDAIWRSLVVALAGVVTLPTVGRYAGAGAVAIGLAVVAVLVVASHAVLAVPALIVALGVLVASAVLLEEPAPRGR